MVVRLAGKLVSYAGPGLTIQEALYGFIMAMIFVNAAQVGILTFDSNTNLAIVVFSMNFTWGAIDALVIILVGGLERKRNVSILIRNNQGICKECAELVKDDLSGTIVDTLDPEDEDRIIQQILSSKIESEEELRKDRMDLYKAGLSSFVITVLTAFPVIIPLILMEDLTTALFAASAFGAVALFFIGYFMSKHIGANKWVLASTLTIIGWAVTLMATFMGG